MAGVRRFRDITAYQRARTLAVTVYRLTRRFPKEDRCEITSQINRAACSIALNIAEGFGLGTTAATLRHFRMARGSLFETDAALEIAAELGMPKLDEEGYALLAETDRVLQALIRSMEERCPKEPSDAE